MTLHERHYEHLARFYREKRVAAGYSQWEVAKECGYSSPQFISNIERGKCSAPMDLQRKLVQIYGVPAREVIKVNLLMVRLYLEEIFS